MPEKLLMSFYGDDFTGSTDAMESLARHGLRTILFTDPPSAQQLKGYPDLSAFGIAGLTRSLPPDQMEQTLRPVFQSLRNSGSPIVHYKVCSTFDSSPSFGSIGRVIDIGFEVFGSRMIPILAAAPALGRYTVFGNHFAKFGQEGQLYRLDQHPSMSRHPVTPMDEADLRRHLAKQTNKRIALLDLLQLNLPAAELARKFDALEGDAALIDLLDEQQLPAIGALLAGRADAKDPLFVVGSSGVESALCAHWKLPVKSFDVPKNSGPIVVVCGSCSPVTSGQIRWALDHGFSEIVLDVRNLSTAQAVERTAAEIRAGKSIVIHTAAQDKIISDAKHQIGPALGEVLGRVLQQVQVRRVIVAGGDTSSQVARAIGIQAVEMIGELTRGSPLCRAHAPGHAADGLEITFKGGQIGKQDFFGFVENPEK